MQQASSIPQCGLVQRCLGTCAPALKRSWQRLHSCVAAVGAGPPRHPACWHALRRSWLRQPAQFTSSAAGPGIAGAPASGWCAGQPTKHQQPHGSVLRPAAAAKVRGALREHEWHQHLQPPWQWRRDVENGRALAREFTYTLIGWPANGADVARSTAATTRWPAANVAALRMERKDVDASQAGRRTVLFGFVNEDTAGGGGAAAPPTGALPAAWGSSSSLPHLLSFAPSEPPCGVPSPCCCSTPWGCQAEPGVAAFKLACSCATRSSITVQRQAHGWMSGKRSRVDAYSGAHSPFSRVVTKSCCSSSHTRREYPARA